MKTLYFALIAAWFAASSVSAEPKAQYGGYSMHPSMPMDSLQVILQAFHDYVNSLEMINVEAGDELQQAIAAIPIKGGTPITPAQEADLRTWLYDFLVAFSVSSSDSLAAAFYLREGINNPEAIEKLKNQLASKGLLKGETPFDILKAGHRQHLDTNEYDYYFGKVSFFDSAFEVSERKTEPSPYIGSLMERGMIPPGAVSGNSPKMKSEVQEHLQAGKPQTFVEVMFIVEEPEEFAPFEGVARTPFFFRMAWDPDKAMWRHVEIVYCIGTPYFLFSSI